MTIGELRHLSFTESEGERGIKEDHFTYATHLKPLNLEKLNIGSKEKHKISFIRDYWDEKTTKEVFDLLKEYNYLFPSSVSEQQGINGDLGEMKIALKPNAHQIKH